MNLMRYLLTIALSASTACAAALPLETVKLPPGFAIELWARVDNPRQMALGGVNAQGGVLYVGSHGAGKVHAVRFDAAYRAGAVTRIADGLQMPSGLAWNNGALYVAAVNRLLRYDDIDRRRDRPPAPVVVTDSLPNAHGSDQPPRIMKHAKGKLKARPPIPPRGGLLIGSLRSEVTKRAGQRISR